MKTEVISRLRDVLSSTQVADASDTVASHCRDYKGYNIGKALAVVYPQTVEDVEKIVAVCRAERVKIVPQGGNTSTYGGAVPDQSGDTIVVSMSRMNKIIDIDLDNNTACVEAGVVLGELNRKLAEVGRWFPLGFGSEDTCQIGGNVAMNSGGNNVLRYGTVRENVLGVEAVLGNGDVFRSLQALRKKCIGYDIGQILIGSEGTLGIVTKAVLKLQPLQPTTETAWLASDSLEAVLRTLDEIRRCVGDRLTSFEVISLMQRQIITAYKPALRDPISQRYNWAIIAEFRDASAGTLLREAVEAALSKAVECGSISDAVIASNETQRRAFWLIRECVLDANKAHGWPVSHDASVPVSQLPTFARRVESEVGGAFPAARFIAAGHAGDGNIHLGVIFEKSAFTQLEDFKAVTKQINGMVFDIAHSLGGHFASEHGIGVQHREAFRRYMPSSAVKLMMGVKNVLDPDGIMNPGKIFQA